MTGFYVSFLRICILKYSNQTVQIGPATKAGSFKFQFETYIMVFTAKVSNLKGFLTKKINTHRSPIQNCTGLQSRRNPNPCKSTWCDELLPSGELCNNCRRLCNNCRSQPPRNHHSTISQSFLNPSQPLVAPMIQTKTKRGVNLVLGLLFKITITRIDTLPLAMLLVV